MVGKAYPKVTPPIQARTRVALQSQNLGLQGPSLPDRMRRDDS
jgi:hypothetical protein